MASYADALAANGAWLVRIEDVDLPRARKGAPEAILAALERLGFEWDGPVWRQSTRTAHYADALAKLAPGFTSDDVLRYWTFREPHAQPVPRIGNRHRIMPMHTPREGLFVANTTQIYPEDRGTNYSAKLGREAAALIAERVPRSA